MRKPSSSADGPLRAAVGDRRARANPTSRTQGSWARRAAISSSKRVRDCLYAPSVLDQVAQAAFCVRAGSGVRRSFPARLARTSFFSCSIATQPTPGCRSRRISSQARMMPSRASRGRRLIVALCRLLVLVAPPLVLGERLLHLLSCPALPASTGYHIELVHAFGDLVGLAPFLV